MKLRLAWSVAVLSTLVANGSPAQTVREACAADATRLCPDTHDLQSRRQCMDAHRAELSEGCRKARQAAAESAANDAQNSTDISNSTPAAAPGARNSPTTPDGGLDSIVSRMAGREFPSIFAPWTVADKLRQPDGRTTVPLSSSESPLAIRARHDFFFSDFPTMGLKVAKGVQYVVLTPEFSPESIQVALNNRAKLLAMNPHMLLFASIQYYSGKHTYLPPDSPFWMHDERNAQYEQNSTEYHSSRIDFTYPQFQDKVAAYCGAVVKTGVFDGCMLDFWQDDDAMASARLALIKKLRAAIGEKAILIGNVTRHLPTRTAQYLNGMYMEGFGARFFPDWHTAAANVIWAESHLRKPAIAALEGWWETTGRGDLALMRQVTTLALVFSNGYVLFADPDQLPTADHAHDWYPFWDKSLGHAVGPLATLNRPDLSGAYTRQYEKGKVVFNPPSNHSVTVNFPEPRRSAATNVTGRSFTVAPGDGDLFLEVSAP